MIKIKLSEEATCTLPAGEVWKILLTVSIMIGFILGIQVLTGHIPNLKSIGALILLNGYWAFIVYLVGRRGWRKLPVFVWPNLLGVSLYYGKYVVPHSFIASPSLQSLASFILFVSFLPLMFTITRKKREAVPVAERVGANR